MAGGFAGRAAFVYTTVDGCFFKTTVLSAPPVPAEGEAGLGATPPLRLYLTYLDYTLIPSTMGVLGLG